MQPLVRLAHRPQTHTGTGFSRLPDANMYRKVVSAGNAIAALLCFEWQGIARPVLYRCLQTGQKTVEPILYRGEYTDQGTVIVTAVSAVQAQEEVHCCPKPTPKLDPSADQGVQRSSVVQQLSSGLCKVRRETRPTLPHPTLTHHAPPTQLLKRLVFSRRYLSTCVSAIQLRHTWPMVNQTRCLQRFGSSQVGLSRASGNRQSSCVNQIFHLACGFRAGYDHKGAGGYNVTVLPWYNTMMQWCIDERKVQ